MKTLFRIMLACLLGPIALAQVQDVKKTAGTNVLATSPLVFPQTGLGLLDTDGTNYLLLKNGANLSSTRSIRFITDSNMDISTYSDQTADGFNLFLGVNSGNTTNGPSGGASSLASRNTGIGRNSLSALTTGYQNTSVGAFAGSSITTGYNNDFHGNISGGQTTTGHDNSGFGNNSLGALTTGYTNSAIGEGALRFVTSGFDNCGIGHGAGYSISTGSRNVMLGAETGVGSPGSLTNAIAIGFGVVPSTNNIGVIGGSSHTDIYFGSELAVSTVHAAKGVFSSTGDILTITSTASGGSVHTYLVGDPATGSSGIFRMLRGNGAAGYQSNGINFDVFGGFQIKANQLGGSGETISLQGAPVVLTHSIIIPSTTSGTVGVYFSGADRFLHTYSDPTADGFNLFGGVNSGNFVNSPSSGASSLASRNTGWGRSTLSGLTTGYQNTTTGAFAGSSLTTGYNNDFYGNISGGVATTAHDNSGFGNNSLGALTTGSQNVAIGEGALRFVTTGTSNTGVGHGAGYSITTGTNNTFLGDGTGVGSPVGMTGSIALGKDVAPSASNIAVIGGSALTDVWFGSESGLAKLHASRGTFTAVTSVSAISLNGFGTAGTAQIWSEYNTPDGSTVLVRMQRGNGAAGLKDNGLNIDLFGGFQIRANQLAASGENISLQGAPVVVTDTTEASVGSGAINVSSGGIYAAKKIVTSSDIETLDVGEGVIVKSPDGTRWRITVSNAGAIVTTSL